VCGLKIASFVKNIVSGEEHLALFEKNLTVANQRGGIGDRLSRIVLRFADVPHESGNRDRLCQTEECVVIAPNKGGALNQVLRRVATNAEFGKDGNIGASRVGVARQFKDARRIPLEIADRRIELRQGYLHRKEIAYGARRSFSIGAGSVLGNSVLAMRAQKRQAGPPHPHEGFHCCRSGHRISRRMEVFQS